MGKQCFVCKKLDYLNPAISFHRFPSDLQLRQKFLANLNLHVDLAKLPKFAYICSAHFVEGDFEYRGVREAKFLKKGAVPLIFAPQCSSDSAMATRSPKRQKSPQNFSAADLESDIDIKPSCSNILKVSESSSTLTVIECEPVKREEHVNIQHFEDVELFEIVTRSSSTTLTASETELQMLLSESDEPYVFDELPPQKRKTKRYTADNISSSDCSTPRKAKRNFRIMKKKLSERQIKVRLLQQTIRRLKARVTNLSSLLDVLKAKSRITDNAECRTTVGEELPLSVCRNNRSIPCEKPPLTTDPQTIATPGQDVSEKFSVTSTSTNDELEDSDAIVEHSSEEQEGMNRIILNTSQEIDKNYEDNVPYVLEVIPRENYVPTKNSKVCELHFQKHDVTRETSHWDEKNGRLLTCSIRYPRLQTGAIPSVFPKCPKYLSRGQSNRHKSKEEKEQKTKEVIIMKNFKNEPTSPTHTIAEEDPFASVQEDQLVEIKSETSVSNESGIHNDVFDAIGKNFAYKLRAMTERQRIISEKIIGDVMYHGQLEMLTYDAHLALHKSS